MKNEKKGLLLLLRFALAALVVVSAVNIGRILWGYRQSAGRYDAIRQEVAAPAPADSAGEADEPAPVDMEKLTELYSGAVGWLRCEDTPIDYPVMQAADNDYYLRRLPDGTRSTGGSLFLDWRCAKDFSDDLFIVYGHNMHDGSMFACLANYAEQDWCDAHPTLELQTDGGARTLHVAYAFSITTGEWAELGFDRAENRSQLVEYAAARSAVSGAPLTGQEPLAVLLTCTNRADEERWAVLCAVR